MPPACGTQEQLEGCCVMLSGIINLVSSEQDTSLQLIFCVHLIDHGALINHV